MISVAILTCNRLPLLQQCLAGLTAQLGDGDEIVVLDTGSADGTREWLTIQPPCVRAMTLDQTADFATARNALVRACSNPVVLMLDDDTVPAGDLLRRVRQAVTTHIASGGPALYGYPGCFPWWWHPALGWTVGMAGPDTISPAPGVAPATSNLAVRRSCLMELPFGETAYPMGQERMYHGGREDADWWRLARLKGWRVEVNPRQIVFHLVPQDRFRWHYVLNRALADGRADWERNPNPARLADATNEIVFGALSLAGLAARCLTRHRDAAALTVWVCRQSAFVSAAGSLWPRLLRAAGPAVVSTAKQKLAPVVAAAVRAMLQPRRSPPSLVTHLVIATPTYLGDTVLVRYLSDSLARALPEARISVISRFPELFQGSPSNVAHADANDLAASAASVRACEFALTPYYHHGSMPLWRRSLAPKSAAFSSDVGFGRHSDYRLAGRLIEKDFGNHELLNLISLGNLICDTVSLKKPVFTRLCPPGFMQNIEGLFAQSSGYAVVQVGAGLPTKEWPVARWLAVAKHLWTQWNLASVVIGDQRLGREVTEQAEQVGFTQYLNLCGQTSIHQLITLLRGCRVLVSACSGPKHLAMALGVPTFTLYGPSDPQRWGAFFDSELHAFVRSPVKLRPSETCEHPLNASMLALQVEVVAHALSNHLKRLLSQQDS